MLLFDLNIEVLPPNSDSNLAQNLVKNRNVTLVKSDSNSITELSETSSSSSVVNADDSPVSVEVAGAYASFPPAFVTRQLFPLTVDNGGETEPEVSRVGSSQTPNSNTTQWLNLAVSGSGLGPGVVAGTGVGLGPNPVRKSRRGPRSRSSQYRGVTFYRRTGRWESHIWDCGKQVYLGGFDTAHAAARAYDRAAIKFRGVDADINFSIADYDEDMKQVKNLSKEEFVHLLRRQNTGFSRGSSRYRGAVLAKGGPLEAPTGQFPVTRVSEQAAVQCNGREAVNNFELNTYNHQIPILANNEGHGHNLDLNLGISITIDGPKARNYMGVLESQTHPSSIQLANGKRPLDGAFPYYSSGAMPLHGQPMASRQSSTVWSGLPQSRPGTYEEKASEEKPAATQSNWAWYMERQGQGGGGGTPNQVQLLSARAASSGFPFSTATAEGLPTSTTLFTQPHSNHYTSNSLHPYGQGRS